MSWGWLTRLARSTIDKSVQTPYVFVLPRIICTTRSRILDLYNAQRYLVPYYLPSVIYHR